MNKIKNKQLIVNSDFDFKNYRIINLSSPLDDNDAVNKLYVDQNLISIEHSITTNISSVVSTEISQRISADSSLNSIISTEISQRISADSSLNIIISTEISQRISSDLSLTTSISSETSQRVYNDDINKLVEYKEITGTTYLLELGDQSKGLVYNNLVSGNTTIPLNSNVPFPVGTVITLGQKNLGQIVINGENGVTVYGSLKSFSQYKFIQLWKTNTDEWYVIGGTD